MQIKPSFSRLACMLVVWPLAACGGPGASPGVRAAVPLATTGAPPSSAARAALDVFVPGPPAGRLPQYVAPTTKAIVSKTYVNAGGMPGKLLGTTVVNLSARSPLCTTNPNGSRTCSVPIDAPAGNDLFVFSTFDEEPTGGSGGIGGSVPSGAAQLGAVQFAKTIVAGRANRIGVSLGGVIASIQLTPAQTSANGAVATTFGIGVTARDASGNVIMAGKGDPYANPIVLSVPNAGGHTKVTLNGGRGGPQITIRHSTDVVAAAYDGRASTKTAPPYHVSFDAVTTDGAASATAPFTPMFVFAAAVPPPLQFAFDPSVSLEELGFLGLAGESAQISVSEYAATGEHTFTATAEPEGSTTCATVATIAPGSVVGTGGSVGTFALTEAAGGGICRYDFTDETFNAVALEVANTTATGPPITVPGQTKIKHVVVLIQENRSLNTLFMNFPGAITATSGQNSKGQTVPLTPVLLEAGIDLSHTHGTYVTSYDGGKMDGFDKNQPILPPHSHVTPPPPNYAYSYVDPSESKPYWDIASAYTLGDMMFESSSTNSYTAHQYLIAGQAAGAINSPSGYIWGCDTPAGTYVPLYGPGPGGMPVTHAAPCFDYTTLATLLDAKSIPWRYYAEAVTAPGNPGEAWSAFDAIRSVRYGSDWTNDVISPETQFFTDLQGGTLEPVTYITPDYGNSDHAGGFKSGGPAWVTSIVDAIGQSPYWDSTAILVTWDDWGGWYDPVPPPQIDIDGDGFRVPLLVVSPYAKHGYVSHTTYEFGSILKFIEGTFGLGTLGTRDLSANTITDCFDFSQTPGPFVPFASRTSVRELQRAPHSTTPPDDN